MFVIALVDMFRAFTYYVMANKSEIGLLALPLLLGLYVSLPLSTFSDYLILSIASIFTDVRFNGESLCDEYLIFSHCGASQRIQAKYISSEQAEETSDPRVL
ncbi:hypothetical protein PILCRDRAFT_405353 [Piloderma croceum F 1598]|uniref:Uncharacterized protein n=1 Tax=Piloderma croceum (strain F 1598) TaxID=765440 RepID=A0A0C3C3S6_PILCF|nr:hypothetical protein PILCRDRAFT_405353 [Piloderma croceum F 1598]